LGGSKSCNNIHAMLKRPDSAINKVLKDMVANAGQTADAEEEMEGRAEDEGVRMSIGEGGHFYGEQKVNQSFDRPLDPGTPSWEKQLGSNGPSTDDFIIQ